MEKRFNYFRWHSHPLGWGVRDSKHDNVIMLGDKGDCARMAERYNNNVENCLTYYDGYHSPEWKNIWLPETD